MRQQTGAGGRGVQDPTAKGPVHARGLAGRSADPRPALGRLRFDGLARGRYGESNPRRNQEGFGLEARDPSELSRHFGQRVQQRLGQATRSATVGVVEVGALPAGFYKQSSDGAGRG